MSFKLSSRFVLLHSLRTLVMALLFLGWGLYLRELLSIPFWIGAFLLGTGIAFFLTSRFRFLPAFGIFSFCLILLRSAVFLFFSFRGPEADPLYLLFDINYFPLLLPLIISWLFTYGTLRVPRLVKWEVIANGWLLFLLFFSQAGYKLELLPHPVYLAGGTALFLLLEILILLLTARGTERSGGKESGPGHGKPGRIFFFILILLLIIGAGLLFFLGRYNRGAVSRGGGLVKPTLFRFDFSRFIKLESEITMNSDLVLLFREEEPSSQPLLRRFILSGYRPEAGFFMSSPPGSPRKNGFHWESAARTIPEERIELEDPGWKGRVESHQEYFLVNFDPTSLLAMNYPVEITPLTNWDTSSFIRNYRVVSRISGFLTWELADTEFEHLGDGVDPAAEGETAAAARAPEGVAPPEMSDEVFHYYTDYGGDEAVRALALEWTDGLENSYDRIMAIQNNLKENYFYSLKPGVAVSGNQLHHFLFSAKKGYCSYFAFSMALLCRSIGIPARVAVGFFIDPELGVMNIYPVRSDMAHAWVEVFFPGYGWINFDPTSQELAPGEDFQFGSLEVDRFLSLVEEILVNRDGLGEEATPEDAAVREAGNWRQSLKDGALAALHRWYILLPFLYLLLAFGRACLIRLQIRLSRKTASKMEGELCLLKRGAWVQGFGMIREESLLEWADRSRAGGFEITPFIRLYLKNRYGPEFSGEEYLQARAYRREFSRLVIKTAGRSGYLRLLILPFRRVK